MGRDTQTIIYYTAVTNGINDITGEAVEGVELTGKVISDSFPQNTSEVDSVEREISFTLVGTTATTTIIQGVWTPKGYTLDLNDGQWALSDTVPNPDSSLYDGVYQSVTSKGIPKGYDTMYIDIAGLKSFRLYIRSYSERYYDMVIVSQLDKTIGLYTSYSDSGLVKSHTSTTGNNSSTAISAYRLVEFTDIDERDHRITIIYRKNDSTDSYDDRGYVLIPKNQE